MPEIKQKDIPLHLHQWKLVEHALVDGGKVYMNYWRCIVCGAITVFTEDYYV